MVEEVTAFLEHEWLVIADRSQSLAGIAVLRQVRTFFTVPCSLFPVPSWTN
ncbi:hypothetical protein [Coleofasciculus sp. E1-EBD-02]|uniref:hypothetical protein n=1 Tax=Coleofasciculus sp. E1-EBD-02 TaxID=3068481 RepID=UPI0040639A9E